MKKGVGQNPRPSGNSRELPLNACRQPYQNEKRP